MAEDGRRQVNQLSFDELPLARSVGELLELGERHERCRAHRHLGCCLIVLWVQLRQWASQATLRTWKHGHEPFLVVLRRRGDGDRVQVDLVLWVQRRPLPADVCQIAAYGSCSAVRLVSRLQWTAASGRF